MGSPTITHSLTPCRKITVPRGVSFGLDQPAVERDAFGGGDRQFFMHQPDV